MHCQGPRCPHPAALPLFQRVPRRSTWTSAAPSSCRERPSSLLTPDGAARWPAPAKAMAGANASAGSDPLQLPLDRRVSLGAAPRAGSHQTAWVRSAKYRGQIVNRTRRPYPKPVPRSVGRAYFSTANPTMHPRSSSQSFKRAHRKLVLSVRRGARCSSGLDSNAARSR